MTASENEVVWECHLFTENILLISVSISTVMLLASTINLYSGSDSTGPDTVEKKRI